MVPQVLEPRFGLHRLDIIKPLDGFNQHRAAQRRLSGICFGQSAKAFLRQQSRYHKQNHRQKRYPDQGTGNVKKQHAKQQEKWNICNRCHSGGGQHLAHMFELADLRYKRAGGAWPRGIANTKCVTEHPVRYPQISRFARYIGNTVSGGTHTHPKQDRHHNADEQNPERAHRLPGHDSVIDLHRKNRASQRQHVGHE